MESLQVREAHVSARGAAVHCVELHIYWGILGRVQALFHHSLQDYELSDRRYSEDLISFSFERPSYCALDSNRVTAPQT
eukprot:6222711-Amphidinium_carterae.1